MRYRPFFLSLLVVLITPFAGRAADNTDGDEPYQPHTPTLMFFVSHLEGPRDADAIRAFVNKLPSAKVLKIDNERGEARVRFDSHVVSYHQVAQAIATAGASIGKKYDPCLKVTVPEYPKGQNAAKVDTLFAGKRLNTRVSLTPIDKTKGEFLIHFLPLKEDPTDKTPQGFNGGHLNHPLHDPPPRGLGLTCRYASGDENIQPAKTL
jgi:copper chaperone CopZ